MSRLHIELLGGLEIAGGGISTRPSLTRKTRALIAYLALQGGRGQSREKLADLLWSNSAEEQARANLRQALSTIRKALNGDGADYLVTEGDHISLTGADLDIDVSRFEHLVADATPRALKRAAALYKGDLLDGFSLKEDQFEGWARIERERLRQLASDALSKLIAHCDEVGDTSRCVETAARLLNLDPLREAAHRILMRAYAAQGRRASALKQFESCREILMRELGLEPEPRTVALYRELRQQRASAPEDETDTMLEQTTKNPALPDGPSVAVLPFENKSSDPEQSYFSDGLTVNIISGLTRFREILVIGRVSAKIAREKTDDVRKMGRSLGVAHIVEGSVHKAGKRVRITAQLMDTTTGQQVWSENYDRNLGDIFAVQDEITNVIVATLAGQIEHSELHRTAISSDEDIAAYDYVLRGRQCLLRFTNEGVIEARQHFERALALEPDHAAAYAGLSISYLNEYEDTWSTAPESALKHAYEFAQKAVALDETLGQARYAIATACYFRGQYELARAHSERALELNPNDYLNLCAKAWQLALSGHPSEGISCSLEAIRRNPLAPDNCMLSIGIAEYLTGQYSEALATFGKMRGWDVVRLACIAACYGQLGRDTQAKATVDEILTFTPDVHSEDHIKHWSAYWSRFLIFENPNDQAKFLKGLRKAGLPA